MGQNDLGFLTMVPIVDRLRIQRLLDENDDVRLMVEKRLASIKLPWLLWCVHPKQLCSSVSLGMSTWQHYTVRQ